MNTSTAPAWVHQKALEVARRFTQDTEPQRRASLQVAVAEAMMFTRPELASSPQQVVDPVGVASELTVMSDVQIDALLSSHGWLDDKFHDQVRRQQIRDTFRRTLSAAMLIGARTRLHEGSFDEGETFNAWAKRTGRAGSFDAWAAWEARALLTAPAALATQATTKAEPVAGLYIDAKYALSPWPKHSLQLFSAAKELPVGFYKLYAEPQAARDAQTPPSVPLPKCLTCGDRGMIGGHSGQTAESYDDHSEPCPDCNGSGEQEHMTSHLGPDDYSVTGLCSKCGGTGVVGDGEINHYSDGTPYLNGPVKCVKDCPACTGTQAASRAPAAEPDDTPLETGEGDAR